MKYPDSPFCQHLDDCHSSIRHIPKIVIIGTGAFYLSPGHGAELMVGTIAMGMVGEWYARRMWEELGHHLAARGHQNTDDANKQWFLKVRALHTALYPPQPTWRQRAKARVSGLLPQPQSR